MRGCAAGVVVAMLMLLPLGFAGGCTQARTFTIYAKPGEARLIIDGVQRGPGPVTQRFEVTGPTDVHHVSAVAPGYQPGGEDLWPDTPHDTVVITLRPLGKKVRFTVGPEPGVVKVNGTPLSPGPVDQAEYTLDANDPAAEYVVTAEREGYEPARRTLRGSDAAGYYPLRMTPVGGESATAMRPGDQMRPVDPGAPTPRSQQARVEPPRPPVTAPQVKPQPPAQQAFKRDIVIRTDPPEVGATIYVAGEELGRNGLDLRGHEFQRDRNGKPVAEAVKATAPGFEGGTGTIRWEDNQGEYVIPLGRRRKEIRIVTDPAGAVVTLDGKAVPRSRDGAAAATVLFPPTDPPGQPTTYIAHVAAPSDAWESQDLKIGWDNGRQDYRVRLAAARSVKVALLRPALVWRQEGGWVAEGRRVETVAIRDVSEGAGRPAATRFAAVPAGMVPDSITVSPDGSHLLYAALTAPRDGVLNSSLRLLNSDGTPGATPPGEGGSLDLTPSFSPDGALIYFASDRGGAGGLNVWSIPVTPDAPGAKEDIGQLTRSGNATLWPTVDSSPQPRLFYEAVLKGAAGKEGEGSEIRVIEKVPGAPPYMTLAVGTRPRPSPRADSVVFTAVDPATGNRDLYLVSDKDGVPLGGSPVNLTNTPDVDECDPVWSRNGVRVAFASNAGADETGARNYDVYTMAVAGADRKPTRVTHNGSWDDCPAWDPAGKAIYFRSNRGGQWAIWKVPVQ